VVKDGNAPGALLGGSGGRQEKKKSRYYEDLGTQIS